MNGSEESTIFTRAIEFAKKDMFTSVFVAISIAITILLVVLGFVYFGVTASMIALVLTPLVSFGVYGILTSHFNL